jgi:hypothetical protein
MNRRFRFGWVLALSLLTPVRGNVQREPEFVGEATETWESFSRAQVYDLRHVELPIFGGAATISGDSEFIWISQIGVAEPNTGGFGLGANAARSHDGVQGYGTSLAQGSTQITIPKPVLHFGGYWGAASGSGPISFRFYDSGGTLIGSDSVIYTRADIDGVLEWAGWQSTTPIGRVEYSGGWVVNDSLRISNVPEPSISWLIAVGVTSGLLLKLKFRSRHEC